MVLKDFILYYCSHAAHKTTEQSRWLEAAWKTLHTYLWLSFLISLFLV